MKQSYVSILLGLASTFLMATAMSAQEPPPPTWHLTPQVGLYTGGMRIADGGSELVSRETIGEPTSVEMGRSPFVGLSVHRALNSYVSVRAAVQGTVFSGPQARLNGGSEPCGPNCTRYLHERESIGTGGIVAGAVDLALKAPATWRVRPYVFYGVGARHAWFDRGDLPEAFAPRNQGFAVGHSGLGLTIGLGGMEVDIEAATYIADQPAVWPRLLGGSDAQTFITFGLRP